MTFTNQTCRVSAIGTGAAQDIAFTFPITSEGDLVVKTRVITTGVEATLALNTHYTVTITGDTGGTVTTITPFVAETMYIHVIRRTPATQSLDLTAGGDFGAETQEDAFDKAMKLAVEARDGLDRCLRLPDTDATAANSLILPGSVARASKYLTFDANGIPTVTATVTPATVITLSAFGASWGVAANAAAGITLLGLGTAAVAAIDTTATLGTSDAVVPSQKAVKTYADLRITTALACALAGAQNITGIKTFTVSPIVPTPTTDYQAATKKYVDDKVLIPTVSPTLASVALLSATTVSFAAHAQTTLYTVPAGKTCILSHAVVVAGSNAAATSMSIGQDGDLADFVPARALGNLNAANDAVILEPMMAATPVGLTAYVAGTLICAHVTTTVGGATNTVYLFGTLY